MLSNDSGLSLAFRLAAPPYYALYNSPALARYPSSEGAAHPVTTKVPARFLSILIQVLVSTLATLPAAKSLDNLV